MVVVWIRKIKGAKCGKVETERRKILKIVRTLLETRLEACVKKEAEKIRKDGRKNKRIRNRKAKNILKIVRRLLETRLEASMKKEAEKIRKQGKKNR